MTGDAGAEEQRRKLQLSAERTGLPLEQLWLRYFAIGGSCGLVEVEAHLLGMMTLPVYQTDMLAHVANERLDEMDRQVRVPVQPDAAQQPVPSGPGVTLVELLRDVRGSTPDQPGRIAADAGRSLDLNVVVYLVDHDESVLVLVPSSTSVGREKLGVDGTLAGRVYRSGQALPLSSGGQAHLWVPLRDGVDRLVPSSTTSARWRRPSTGTRRRTADHPRPVQRQRPAPVYSGTGRCCRSDYPNRRAPRGYRARLNMFARFGAARIGVARRQPPAPARGG